MFRNCKTNDLILKNMWLSACAPSLPTWISINSTQLKQNCDPKGKIVSLVIVTHSSKPIQRFQEFQEYIIHVYQWICRCSDKKSRCSNKSIMFSFFVLLPQANATTVCLSQLLVELSSHFLRQRVAFLLFAPVFVGIAEWLERQIIWEVLVRNYETANF